MDSSTFYMVCSLIALIASTITALCTIFNFIKKPAKKYKEKLEKEQKDHDCKLKKEIIDSFKEILPELLKAHDLEVRNRYLADRERYLHEIKDSVLSDTKDELHQVKVLGLQYEALVISARDVLREKIVKIYLSNKDEKTITMIERERLDQFYKDYKALNGNSYIDKYYNRMKKWEVIDDDDDDEDEMV